MSLSAILGKSTSRVSHVGFLGLFDDVSRRADEAEDLARRYGGRAAGDAVGRGRAAVEGEIRDAAGRATGAASAGSSSIADSAVSYIMGAVVNELSTLLRNIPRGVPAQQTGFSITDSLFSSQEEQFFPYRRRNVTYKAIQPEELEGMTSFLVQKVNSLIDSLPNSINMTLPNPIGIGGNIVTRVNMAPHKERVKTTLVLPLIRDTIAPMLAQAQSTTAEHVKKNVILVASLSAITGLAIGTGATYLIMRNR